MKVYKRGSGMMWFMVSALLSITLNVKKQSETQKIDFLKKMHCMNPTRRQGQRGAPPTETSTVVEGGVE